MNGRKLIVSLLSGPLSEANWTVNDGGLAYNLGTGRGGESGVGAGALLPVGSPHKVDTKGGWRIPPAGRGEGRKAVQGWGDCLLFCRNKEPGDHSKHSMLSPGRGPMLNMKKGGTPPFQGREGRGSDDVSPIPIIQGYRGKPGWTAGQFGGKLRFKFDSSHSREQVAFVCM